jgi:hypothetical protein
VRQLYTISLIKGRIHSIIYYTYILMTYLLAITGVLIIIGLLYYNNRLYESFDSETSKPPKTASEPEPTISKPALSEPADYVPGDSIDETPKKPTITNQLSLYKAYMDTNCKNNYCCEDGMTFNEDLGVCIKNNDSSYLSEFHVFGTSQLPQPKINDLR